jgi:hypothetical protein
MLTADGCASSSGSPGVLLLRRLGSRRAEGVAAAMFGPAGLGMLICMICRIAGVACSYTYAPTCMSLTVATIVNSALPFVSAARRAMHLRLAKEILLTFLASFWGQDWNGDGPRWARQGESRGPRVNAGEQRGRGPHDEELSLTPATCSLRLLSSH